jgi:hypothetical protein
VHSRFDAGAGRRRRRRRRRRRNTHRRTPWRLSALPEPQLAFMLRHSQTAGSPSIRRHCRSGMSPTVWIVVAAVVSTQAQPSEAPGIIGAHAAAGHEDAAAPARGWSLQSAGCPTDRRVPSRAVVRGGTVDGEVTAPASRSRRGGAAAGRTLARVAGAGSAAIAARHGRTDHAPMCPRRRRPGCFHRRLPAARLPLSPPHDSRHHPRRGSHRASARLRPPGLPATTRESPRPSPGVSTSEKLISWQTHLRMS